MGTIKETEYRLETAAGRGLQQVFGESRYNAGLPQQADAAAVMEAVVLFFFRERNGKIDEAWVGRTASALLGRKVPRDAIQERCRDSAVKRAVDNFYDDLMDAIIEAGTTPDWDNPGFASGEDYDNKETLRLLRKKGIE